MPDLSEREKTLLKLIFKRELFGCRECEQDRVETNHDNHKIDIHNTYNDIALWFGYIGCSLSGRNLDLGFLGYDSGNLQIVLDELVTEGFLIPMDKPCAGCGGLVYVRTDTMKQLSSVLVAEDGIMCRFA